MAVNLGGAALKKAWRQSGLTAGDAFVWSTNLYFGATGYSRARQEGHGVPGSVIKGTLDAVLIDTIGFKTYFPLLAARGLPGAATKGVEALGKHARDMSSRRANRPFQNNTFVDTEQNYTMRQAGMAMAEQSKYNLQHSMLGNEAQHLHR